jgi:2-polyprenyl-3-methyl-5-hydroxy-6-metoxy-1,4-benzoquinol methylase
LKFNLFIFKQHKGFSFVTTINRTPQSYLLAILAAEYVLKLVPQGTHNWEKFVKPNEIKEILEKSINCNFHF